MRRSDRKGKRDRTDKRTSRIEKQFCNVYLQCKARYEKHVRFLIHAAELSSRAVLTQLTSFCNSSDSDNKNAGRVYAATDMYVQRLIHLYALIGATEPFSSTITVTTIISKFTCVV